MARSFFKQLALLLWKNWKLKTTLPFGLVSIASGMCAPFSAVATSSSLPVAVDADGGGMAAVPVHHHGSDEAQFPARTTRR